MTPVLRSRPGLSLLELLLFVGLLAIVGVAVIAFLWSTTDSQLRQQAITDIEQNGAQILQGLAYHVRHAERVLDPPAGGSGLTLALQMGGPDVNPTIVGIQSGALLMIEGFNEYGLADASVTVSDFRVHNTSAEADKPSVYVRFTLTRQIPLPTMPSYSRVFESAFTLFPDDETSGDACGCTAPFCTGSGTTYVWNVCEEGGCTSMSGALVCG